MLNSLGDHIRKKRLDLDLMQKDIAKILKVEKETVWNWENNRGEPEIKYYPAIMDFLGYCPYVKPQTWGEKLKLFRTHSGLTFKQLAKNIGVDPCSLQRWEKGKIKPWKSMVSVVENYFNQKLPSQDFDSSCEEKLNISIINFPPPQPVRNITYSDKLDSLGDHIRKKRLDLKLLQKDVGELLGVKKATICNWENNNCDPEICYYPMIMNFLGYCPYVRPQNWGEQLKLFRIHKGLTLKQLSEKLGINQHTLKRWEKRSDKPWKSMVSVVDSFFSQN